MIPLRPSGDVLGEAGFQRLIALSHGERIVRVLAATSEWEAGELQRRFGTPRQQDPQTGICLWAFEAPRWSIESRPGPTPNTWTLEAKFLADAVAAGLLTTDALDRMYVGLNTA
jgi:hypothetical protein